MIEGAASLRRRMEDHAVRGYPAEVCGILLGQDGEPRRLAEVREARNLRGATARDRYEIDPQDILRADREAREAGLAMVGFYHSHPDHPAAPSDYDTRRAWPWYSYVILSTTAEGVAEARAWRLEDGRMVEEPLRFMKQQSLGGREHGET